MDSQYKDKGYDTLKIQLSEYLASQLEPGEQLRTAFFASYLPMPWLALLIVLVVVLSRQYAVVLTNRRVLVIQCSWNRQPQSVLRAAPLHAVSLREWKPVGLVSKLQLDGVGIDGVTLRVNSQAKPDAEALVAALSAKTKTAPTATTSG
jgi:hypothetical protein